MYTGSMLGAGALMFAVWGYVISHAKSGKVELNIKHIAFLLGETELDVAGTIEKLCSPDPSSRSKESDGKRLIRIGEFLYEVVNHEKYRQMATEAERRDYQRNWDRTHRQRPNKQSHRNKSDKIRQQPTKSDSPYASVYASESESDLKGKESEENQYEQRFPDNSLEVGGSQEACHLHARTALFYLNEKTDRKFRETSYNLALISARLQEEGVDIEGIKLMIDRQIAQWKGTRFTEFLRPSTLFGPKFDSYYATRNESVSSHQGDSPASAPRNRGTFNEGQTKKYNLQSIQKNRELQSNNEGS